MNAIHTTIDAAIKKLCATVFCVLLVGCPAWATDLRGRIDGTHPYAQYPFPLNGAKVDLWVQTPQGWYLASQTFTGPDGMYYFFQIMPGEYTLQVNGILNFPLFVRSQPYQDIQPILFH